MLLPDDDYEDTSTERELILDQYLPFRLAVLAERMSEGFCQRSADDYNLSIGEWRVMATLYRHEPQSAYEICSQSNMDKVQISRTIARLDKKKWLDKREDNLDRRRQLLSLTQQGRTVFAEIISKALAYEADIYTALNPDDHAALNRVLQKLSARVDKLVK